MNKSKSSANITIDKYTFNQNYKQVTDLQSVKGMEIAHLNICSLYHKLDFVKIMLESESVNILGISESWLHSDIDDDELNISGYHNIIRNDRVADRYGGVAIYCKKGGYKHINRKELHISHSDIETAWIEIRLPQTRPLFICTIYRPENCLTSALEILEEQVSQVSGMYSNPEIVIMGDFNVDYLNRNYEY